MKSMRIDLRSNVSEPKGILAGLLCEAYGVPAERCYFIDAHGEILDFFVYEVVDGEVVGRRMTRRRR